MPKKVSRGRLDHDTCSGGKGMRLRSEQGALCPQKATRQFEQSMGAQVCTERPGVNVEDCRKPLQGSGEGRAVMRGFTRCLGASGQAIDRM